jgi:PilZ domain
MSRRSFLRGVQARDEASVHLCALDGAAVDVASVDITRTPRVHDGDPVDVKDADLRMPRRVTFADPEQPGHRWIGRIESTTAETFVVELIDADDALELPDDLDASTSVTGAVMTFSTLAVQRSGRLLTCTIPDAVYRTNRRTLFRVPAAIPIDVAITARSASPIETTTLDIGHGGIRVLLPEAIDVGTAATLAVRLGDEDVITPAAHVCYSYLHVGGYSTGLAFDRMSSAESKSLSHAIGIHQRRLLPRVESRLLATYTLAGTMASRAATVVHLSPGSVTMVSQDKVLLGGRLNMSLRLGNELFALEGTIVDIDLASFRRPVIVALDVADGKLEDHLRACLHDFLENAET